MGVKADSAYTCEYKSNDGTVIKIIKNSDGHLQVNSSDGNTYGVADSLVNLISTSGCNSTNYIYSYKSSISKYDYIVTTDSSLAVKIFALDNKYNSDDSGNKTNGSGNYSNLLDNSWAVNIATDGCPSIFGSANDSNSIFGIMHTYIFNPIRWLTPIILLVMTTLDFAKVVFIDDKDGIKKAQGKFVKRAIVAVIIFFAPFLTEILLSLIDGVQVTECLKNIDISGL